MRTRVTEMFVPVRLDIQEFIVKAVSTILVLNFHSGCLAEQNILSFG